LFNVLQALGTEFDVPDRPVLEAAANRCVTHHRLPRIDAAERTPSGRANCRCCHGPIPGGSWRIRLVFFEEGRFSPGGFLHVACRVPYFGIDDILDQLLHFSRELSLEEREDLRRACQSDVTRQ
jgi:hypothetical protein